MSNIDFLETLESVIQSRMDDPPEGSYTASLVAAGPKRIAQKVGEEGVELALAAVAGDRDETIDEAADLVYHLLVLLNSGDISLADVAEKLKARHGES